MEPKAMKCMLNPSMNEVKRVTETEAKRLASYGWEYITKGEFKAHLAQPSKPSTLRRA